jgi:hypothetical protein
MWRSAQEDAEHGGAPDESFILDLTKKVLRMKWIPNCRVGPDMVERWVRPKGKATCLEKPLVVRAIELSCRLWVFPFAREALALAGIRGDG